MADLALTLLAVVLLVNVLAALVRVVQGPTGRDRLTGVLFGGTAGAGILAILSVTTGASALRDVALGIVALAAVMIVARWTGEGASEVPS